MPIPTDFTDAPILDQTLINEAQSLMRNKFPQMIAYYMEDTQGYIAYIEKAYAENNVEGLIPPAHTAKSSSRQMGALRLSAIARTIELEARDAVTMQRNLQDLGPLLASLKTTFAETEVAFHQVA